MEREEYERKVLQELRGLLFEPDGRTRAHAVGYLGNRVQVEEVRIGVSRPEGAREMVLVYRDLRRPEGLLGWRVQVADTSEEEPAIEATVLWATFMEHIEASAAGLP
jgi:hypothetical protein